MSVLKSVEPLAPWFSALVSIVAVTIAWLSYRRTSRIQDELKSDDILIAGILHNPDLQHPDHANCVIQTTLFNKGNRKVYVDNIRVVDDKGVEIQVTWADRIDTYGNPKSGPELIGIVDSAQLCIRRNDGLAFRTASVAVSHSYSTTPLMLRYDIAAGWQEYFAR